MAAKPSSSPWDNPMMAKLMHIGEKITGQYAQSMIKQSGLPEQAATSKKIVVLDNACGSGVVLKQLYDNALLDNDARLKLEVTCADLADAMVGVTQAWVTTSGLKKVTVTKADAMNTGLPSDHFSHIFWNFGPFLLPRPFDGLRECFRMLQPGGTLGVTSWMKVAWMDEYRPVFEANPQFPPFPDDVTFLNTFSETGEEWQTLAQVQSHLESVGFVDVKAEKYEHTTNLSLEETIQSLPGSMGMTQEKLWTSEQKQQYAGVVNEAIKEHLRAKYQDVVEWHWVAIVGTARKPS